jgi:hypothetical protein
MQAGGGPPSLAPTMSWFEVEATKAHQQAGQMGTLDVSPIPPNVVSLDPGAAAGHRRRRRKLLGNLQLCPVYALNRVPSLFHSFPTDLGLTTSRLDQRS